MEESSNHRSSSRHQAYTNSGYSSYPSPTAPDHMCKACGGRFDALERKVMSVSGGYLLKAASRACYQFSLIKRFA